MASKSVEETFECACGKEFTRLVPPYRRGATLENFCSRACQSKYSWYGRHSWLYNKEDLKTYREKHLIYKNKTK